MQEFHQTMNYSLCHINLLHRRVHLFQWGRYRCILEKMSPSLNMFLHEDKEFSHRQRQVQAHRYQKHKKNIFNIVTSTDLGKTNQVVPYQYHVMTIPFDFALTSVLSELSEYAVLHRYVGVMTKTNQLFITQRKNFFNL